MRGLCLRSRPVEMPHPFRLVRRHRFPSRLSRERIQSLDLGWMLRCHVVVSRIIREIEKLRTASILTLELFRGCCQPVAWVISPACERCAGPAASMVRCARMELVVLVVK